MIEVTQADPWECFSDASYYDMWCVRLKTDRTFGAGIHVLRREEAEHLRDFLNARTTAEAAKDARIAELEAELAAASRNIYRLQTGGDRLCASLRRIAEGCDEPAAIARRALDHKEPDPKDWDAALEASGRVIVPVGIDTALMTQIALVEAAGGEIVIRRDHLEDLWSKELVRSDTPDGDTIHFRVRTKDRPMDVDRIVAGLSEAGICAECMGSGRRESVVCTPHGHALGEIGCGRCRGTGRLAVRARLMGEG